MRRPLTFFVALCIPLLTVLPAQAANKYVSDQLRISLRDGQGNQFNFIKTLLSGDKLVVLEETETGYTKVKTADGTEGWVRTQYLIDEPIAADKLARAEEKLEKLNTQNKSLKEELAQLKKDKAKLDTEHKELQTSSSKAEKELEHLNKVAARPKQLAADNIELEKKNFELNNELVLLKQEKQVSKDRSERNWFIAGAGVVIVGMIIGLLIPKLRFKKKDSWSNY